KRSVMSLILSLSKDEPLCSWFDTLSTSETDTRIVRTGDGGSSADVHARTPQRIGFGLAEHLAGDRGGIAFAERQELQHVRDRVALGPAEIHVRQTPCGVPGVQ